MKIRAQTLKCVVLERSAIQPWLRQALTQSLIFHITLILVETIKHDSLMEKTGFDQICGGAKDSPFAKAVASLAGYATKTLPM